MEHISDMNGAFILSNIVKREEQKVVYVPVYFVVHVPYFISAEINDNECSECSEHIKSDQLANHMMTVHDKTYPCEKKKNCRWFKRKSGRNSHERTHDKTKDYVCRQCGKEFTRQFNLTRHADKIH